MNDTRKQPPRKTVSRVALEWLLTLVVALAIALPIRAYAFSMFRVDGHSMDNTLADGEMMFTTKFDYLLGDPGRFDVVICRYPGRDDNFVKRVVGLPGDMVAVEGGYLFVNGERYEEDYIVHRPNYTLPPTAVPEDMYFVLGDNRANSNDSHVIGPLRRDQIIAHVRAVAFPLNQIGLIR